MLRLRRLSLKNFLSHKDTTVNFSDTSYVIIGENASGKTSILRGIFFSLFGEDIVFGKKNLINLINRDSTSSTLSIEFIMNNHTYLIERKLTPKGSQQVEVRKNEKLAAKGVKVSEEYLKEGLGLNPETFRNTVYVPQGELVTFLEGTPKARREILNRLFGLEEIKEKNETIKTSLNRIKAELKRYEYYIEQIEKLKEKKEALKKEIVELNQTIEEEVKEIEDLEKLLKEQQLLFQEFEKKKIQIEGLNREKELIISQFKKIENRLNIRKEELKKIETLKKELPKIKEKLKVLPSLKEMAEKAQTLKAEKQKLQNISLEIENYKKTEKKIEELSKKIENREKLLKEKTIAYQKITGNEANSLKKLEGKFKVSEKNKEKHEELNQKLIFHTKRATTIKEKLENLKALDINSLEKEKKETEELIQKLRESGLSLKEKLKEHRERMEKLKNSQKPACPICETPLSPERKRELLKESEKFIKENKIKLIQLKNNIEQAKEKLKLIEKNIQENLIVSQNIRTLKEDLKAEENTINKLKEEIEKIGFSENEYFDIKNRYEKLKTNKATLEAEIAKEKEYLKQLKKEIEQEKENLKKADIQLLLDEKEKIERKISTIHSKIKRIKETYSIEISNATELKKEIKTLETTEKKAAEMEAEIKRENEIKNEIKELDEEIKSARLKSESIEKESQKIDYNSQHHKIVKNSLTEIESRTEKLKSEHNRKKGTIAQKEKQLKEIEEEIKEIGKTVEKIKALKSTHDIIKEIADGFNPATGFIVKLREQLLPEISKICKELFEEFNFEFHEISIEEDLTVKFGTANRGSITLDQLSGGQKVAFALALRFALARKFMSAFELLILDEPTIHLDDERKRELANILMELKGKIPQMIIVTHDPELEVAGDKIIKVEKTAAGSKITFTEGEYA